MESLQYAIIIAVVSGISSGATLLILQRLLAKIDPPQVKKGVIKALSKNPNPDVVLRSEEVIAEEEDYQDS